jgi:membrane associated rhomboid family serine protease
VLVGTKVDLLPPGADPAAVAAWLQAAAAFKRINAVSTHLVGALGGWLGSRVVSALEAGREVERLRAYWRR